MSLIDNLLKSSKPKRIEGVTCDKCNYEMKQAEIKFKYETVDPARKVRRKYFECPKCKTRYTIQYENDSIYFNLGRMNYIRNEIQKIQSRIIKKKDTVEIELLKKSIKELIKQYELIYCENLAISNKYKNEFESQ
ncbi:hypothetical protein [Clostridium botulinum]|uniref:hypothetical protein n=1 Tax=Clostridium botulinum TaxID=1491 RepID=UPI001E5E78FA|nr:hypothetical protein [Clostridium botulinum]MCD3223793.1 hypothetical protein [Clostridium botulinum C/D]MCD3295307.1 hypothetical protein [Clostridium botulinum C/D]